MACSTQWPVRVAAVEPADVGSVLWRFEGQLNLTAVVKARFGLVPDQPMLPLAPKPLRIQDEHESGHPMLGLVGVRENLPRLQRAEVLCTGYAYAPKGSTRTVARIALIRDAGTVLDKAIHIYGDRRQPDEAPAPFEQMPLGYERSYGGVGFADNPLGVGYRGYGDKLPNIVSSDNPSGVAANFGPIPASFPRRRKLLGGLNCKTIEEGVAEIPDGFDWSYFQSAPQDQQLDELRGDEWLILDSLHPTEPRLRTQLPGAQGVVWVYGGEAVGAPTTLPLVADMLHIDTKTGTCSIVWRGSFPVSHEAALDQVVIVGALQRPGHAITWPEPSEIDRISSLGGKPDAPEPARRALRLDDTADLETTAYLGDGEVNVGPVLPFDKGPPLRLEPAKVKPDTIPESPFEGTMDLTPEQERDAKQERTPFVLTPAGQTKPRPATIPGAPWAATSGQPVSPPRGDRPTTVDLPLEADGSASREDAPRPGADEAGSEVYRAPPPVRTTDAIRFVCDDPLVGFALPFQTKPGRDSLVIVVKATCAIGPTGQLMLIDEPDPPSGDVHVDDDPMHTVLYPDDFAVFKPRADVLLTGHAYAGAAKSVAGRAGFSFGRKPNAFKRDVAVFGARKWQSVAVRLLPSEPLPFDKVPLLYERAFGGPGVDANPVGLGKAGDYLPQLEDPKKLIKSPDDAPAPVCFAGIPPLWSERARKTGTYDSAWKNERWPYFPADLDWSYFQAAPPAQQLDFLAGDEPFEIVGMHPEHPVLRGTLPLIRARCFAQKTEAAGGAFHEVLLRLDTVTFDVDAMKTHLVWRGLFEVRDDEASELAEMFLLAESTAGPRRDPEAARAVYERVRQPRPPAPVEPPPPVPVPAALIPPIEAAPEPAAPPLGTGSQPSDPQALRGRVLAALTAGGSLEGLDLSGADLHEVDLSGRCLAGALLKGASLRGAKLCGADLGGAVLADADLTGADCAGADFTRADLTSAVLEDACLQETNLTGTVLSGARAARARFSNAKGEGTRFVHALLTGAVLDGAVLGRADLSRARLDDATFQGAQIPHVRLYDAVGTRASFKGADMSNARADETRLEKCDFSEIEAPSSVWDKAKLSGSTFQGAVLVESGFVKATCEKCIFAAADLTGSRLTRANLSDSLLRRANLMKAQLDAARLIGADLRGANLHGAETHRAKLDRARLDDAIITGTKLAEGRR